MIPSDFSYKIYNGNILQLEWQDEIIKRQTQKIHDLAFQLKNHNRSQFRDIVPAYHSLTIFLNDTLDDPAELIQTISTLYHSVENDPSSAIPGIWKIPVVYGGIHGPDFDAVCIALSMNALQLIERHTAPVYDVHFIGFLPGFPYLGGLDPELHLARKAVPSASIVAGAVGIGGSQTGIYPVKSPGGWHIIGNTPFPLFDLNRNPQIVIQSGDKVQFYSIAESEIEAAKLEIQQEIDKMYSI